MTKLYISEETLNKLSSSKDFQGYTKMFNGFVVNHPKSQQSQKKQYTTKGNKEENQNQKETSTQFLSPHQPTIQKELTQDEIIQIALQQMKDSLARTRNSYHYPAHKTKLIALKKKKKNRNNLQISSSQIPKKLKIKTLKIQKKTNKTTSSSKAFSIDYNNLIDNYESRQVEFGHGRARSKEWNDEIAKSFQKELKERRKNPDWTDRFALK